MPRVLAGILRNFCKGSAHFLVTVDQWLEAVEAAYKPYLHTELEAALLLVSQACKVQMGGEDTKARGG